MAEVECSAFFFAQAVKSPAAGRPDGRGNAHAHLGRRSVLPLGVGEHVQVGKVQGFDKVVRLAEILVRFGGESHDHIRPDAGMGHQFPDALYPVAVQGGEVAPAHLAQHLVATALQGDVEMRNEPPAAGDEFQDGIGEQVGFDRGNADPVEALDPFEGLHQIEEGLARPLRAPPVAGIDPGEYDLADAARDDGSDALQDAFQRLAARAASRPGNGAVGTAVVAAVLDLEKGPGTFREGIGPVVGDGLRQVGAHHLGRGAARVCGKQLRDAKFVGRAHHQAHPDAAADFLRIDLGIATGRHHESVLAAAQHSPHQAAHAAVGIFGDGAGIDHVHLGVVFPFDPAVALRLERAGDGGGLGKVQLAPQGVEGDGGLLFGLRSFHRGQRYAFCGVCSGGGAGFWPFPLSADICPCGGEAGRQKIRTFVLVQCVLLKT